jgi:hypothetical protein
MLFVEVITLCFENCTSHIGASRPGFHPRPVRVGFVVDKVALVLVGPSLEYIGFFPHGSTALVDLGLLIVEVFEITLKPHSVGLLWTSDRPVAETST